MIGKITPKGESDPTPEEKLLRAIFGDKAGDVKDASLKANPSLHGVVIDTALYSRSVKDRKARMAERAQMPLLEQDYQDRQDALLKRLLEKLNVLLDAVMVVLQTFAQEGCRSPFAGDPSRAKGLLGRNSDGCVASGSG
jgi:DNA-directed RNA polymerase beta subunit